jgi:hypothetical protein
MPTINQLSQLNQLSGSDQLPVYSASNGDARKASLSTLLAYIEAQFVSPDYVTQYASPNVNGTNVQVASTTASTWLFITPTAPFASMTITPPPAAQLADGLELLVVCSQSVGALTVPLNGATAVVGAPSALSANSSFSLRYDATSTSWYAVQTTAQISSTIAWTPTVTVAAPAVNTTFAGRYTQVGNLVTLEFSFTLGAGGSFSFTTATDYITGLPVGIQPTSQRQVAASSPNDGWQLVTFYDTGTATWRLLFLKIGSPTFSITNPPAPTGQYRFVISYLL